MRNANGTPGRKASASPPRNKYTSAEWPCVFNGSFIREQIDPRIKAEWAARRSDKPKFGDLRNTFRREHCRNVNPWGSESCPFKEDECAIAFLKGVQDSLGANNPHGYFIKVCRSSGALRADMAVEHRARMRTDVSPEQIRMGSPVRAGVPARPDPIVGQEQAAHAGVARGVETETREGVRRSLSRPGHIGAVLGSLDLRSRPLPDHDEQKGTR